MIEAKSQRSLHKNYSCSDFITGESGGTLRSFRIVVVERISQEIQGYVAELG